MTDDMTRIDCPEYNALLGGIEAAKAQVSKAGKTAVAALFKAYFAESPDVKAIAWTQYTPHFNDGDPCEFSTGEVYVTTKDGIAFDELSRIGDGDEDDETGFKNSYSLDDGPLKESLRRIARSMDSDIFEVAFGDHVMVIATPDGFHVNKYDHD